MERGEQLRPREVRAQSSEQVHPTTAHPDTQRLACDVGDPFSSRPRYLSGAQTANMSKGSKYLLVSLPTSITPSHHADDALTALRSTVTKDGGTAYPFAIPTFKIGTLDALVQQADDLSKLHSACEGVVGKVGESLKTILDGDEEKLQQQKTINDSMCGFTHGQSAGLCKG